MGGGACQGFYVKSDTMGFNTVKWIIPDLTVITGLNIRTRTGVELEPTVMYDQTWGRSHLFSNL